jgi:hypothetical protein
MLENCCTLAQCNQQARSLTILEPLASISCLGNTDKFPARESKVSVFVEPFFDKLTNIPAWVITVTLIAIILMFVYLVLLVFC